MPKTEKKWFLRRKFWKIYAKFVVMRVKMSRITFHKLGRSFFQVFNTRFKIFENKYASCDTTSRRQLEYNSLKHK